MQEYKSIQKMRPEGRFASIPATSIEIQTARYQGVCYIEGPRFGKKLSLTFDDGPSRFTEILLDLLKDLGIKATFFWLGRNIEEFGALAGRALAEGHTFGNHSFDHADFTKIDIEEVLSEQIRKTQLIYRETLGIAPTLVRPPFGKITDELVETLKGMGMKVVFWSVDSGDLIAGNMSADRIAKRVMDNVHEEAIVLIHDGVHDSRDTIKAVRSIITNCRDRGYQFVTVHDLIGAKESLFQG